MSRSRLWRCTRQWSRTLQPIRLGQSRGGLFTAAFLLAVWQLAGSASARQTNPGFSENAYFRVSWDYDLAAGTGQIDIMSRFRFGESITVLLLDDFDFLTFGQEFDSINVRGSNTQFRVDPVGNDFLYSPDPYLAFINEATIDVTFPTEGIELVDTDLGYDGHGYFNTFSTAFFPFVIPPSSMNFVSITTICEPCDTNCDGRLDAFDIEPLLDLLFDPKATPCDTCTGDVNGDGTIDAFDIEPFLECLFP